MKKQKITVLGMLLTMLTQTFPLFSQDYVYDWVRSAGGDGWDLATEIVTDSRKNIYITGGFQRTIFFGNDSLISKGDRDIFIAKYDSLGSLQWLQQIGGAGYDTPEDLVLDKAGNLLLAGSFQDSCFAGIDTLCTEHYISSFIAKLNPGGTVLKVGTFGVESKANKLFILPENDSLYSLAGTFHQTFTIDGDTLKSAENSRMFISNFDDNLKHVDTHFFNANTNTSLKAVEKQDSCMYILCEFTDSISINGQNYYSFGYSDVLLMKTDKELNPLQVKHLPGFGTDKAKALLRANDGLYAALEFDSNLYFDTLSLSSRGGKDILLIKTDSVFNTLWHRQIGSTSDEYAKSLLQNRLGAVYLSGSFSDSLRVGNKSIVSDKHTADMFILKYMPDGAYAGIKQTGGKGDEDNNVLIADKDNYLYIIGNFNYNLAFETDSVSSDSIFDGGPDDIYMARFYDCDYARFPDIGADTAFCGQGQLKVLNADGGLWGNFRKYRWSSGQHGITANVYQTGFYSVATMDSHKCLARSDSVYVRIHPLPQPDLGEDVYVTLGESTELFGGYFDAYLWSNDSTSASISAAIENSEESMKLYELTVTDSNNCSGYDDIYLILAQAAYATQPAQDAHPANTQNNAAGNEQYAGSPVPESKPILPPKVIADAGSKALLPAESLVYPNPSGGHFWIDFRHLKQVPEQISAYTAEGRLIRQIEAHATPVEFNLQTKGIHYIILETKDYLFFEKLIIE